MVGEAQATRDFSEVMTKLYEILGVLFLEYGFK
jgi:hypothetical protein